MDKKVDYIRRDEAINYAQWEGAYKVVMRLEEMKAADVQPVKRGKWSNQMLFDDGFGGGRVGYICSACKKYVPFKGNFCGECGADMREEV